MSLPHLAITVLSIKQTSFNSSHFTKQQQNSDNEFHFWSLFISRPIHFKTDINPLLTNKSIVNFNLVDIGIGVAVNVISDGIKNWQEHYRKTGSLFEEDSKNKALPKSFTKSLRAFWSQSQLVGLKTVCLMLVDGSRLWMMMKKSKHTNSPNT
jgi:hypothetical protein